MNVGDKGNVGVGRYYAQGGRTLHIRNRKTDYVAPQ